MITKGSFLDIVQSILSGGTNNPKVKQGEIQAVADLAIGTLIGYYYKGNERESYYEIPDSFTRTYKNVKIKFDQDRNEFFCFIPANRIVLSNDRDIRQVSAMRAQNKPFTRLNNSASFIFNSLEAGKLLGTTYYTEIDKIFFDNLPTLAGGSPMIDEVLVKQIPSIRDLRDDEPMPVAAEFEAQLLQMVQQMIMGEKVIKSDDYDDNSNNNT